MLYDTKGNRKYLTSKERKQFLIASKRRENKTRTFCETLAYTGARISEVLALSPARVDCAAKGLVIESLKKRRRGVFRIVPVPDDLLKLLINVHHIKDIPDQHSRLWPWSRTKAWRIVRGVMTDAGIPSSVAKPKALRHAFGVRATQTGVALNLVSKWLGHSRLETTAIYANALGEEERSLARRMWK